MFSESKALQRQREALLKEIANLAQMLRDQQLGNVYMMEDIDE